MTLGGVTFDSKKEAARWQFLLKEQAAGRIQSLRRQVRIRIPVNGVIVCAYVADAVYIKAGKRVVEDTKSVFTRKLPVYRLKKKLLKAALNLDIEEA